jgi:hypothetical protein
MLTAAMGWIGTIGSIAAYLMLSRGQLRATSLRYAALNGTAGVLAGSASAVYGAWPSAVSNLVWALIAVHSAVTTLRARRHPIATVTPLPPTDHDAQRQHRPQHLRLVAA